MASPHTVPSHTYASMCLSHHRSKLREMTAGPRDVVPLAESRKVPEPSPQTPHIQEEQEEVASGGHPRHVATGRCRRWPPRHSVQPVRARDGERRLGSASARPPPPATTSLSNFCPGPTDRPQSLSLHVTEPHRQCL